MPNKMLEAALEYLEKGFSVVPIGKTAKVPLVKWKIYQKEKATKEQIEEWFKIYPSAQICIVTGEISNLFVIDCDSPETFEFVSGHLSDSLEVPIVKTPRENWHLWFSYPWGTGLTVAANCIMKNLDYRGEGGIAKAPPSINGNGNKYEWLVKGNLFDLPPVPESLLQLIKSNSSCSSINTNSISVCVDTDNGNAVNNGLHKSTNVYTGVSLSFNEPGRDQTLFHIGNCLFRSGMRIENVRQVIDRLAQTCNPVFPEKERARKIQSILERAEKRERPIAEDIRGFIGCLQVGTFCLRDVYTHLQVSTREDKKAVWVALKRIEGELIEKNGTQAGHYKIMDKNLKLINLKDKSDLSGELSIKFPLGIHEFIKPMPGCVYIVAGEPDAGKSCFLMNFAKKNYKDNIIHYFSSEMGKEEFLDRLQYFWPDVENEPNVKFYERDDSFDEVIFPDDINIVDYMSLYDEFYKMAGLINSIGKKLKKGIAFIALQKPKGREEALGGDRTKDLARLYLSMNLSNVMKIVKAKNWRDSRLNPNRMSIQYQIVDGCKFINSTPWRKE